MAPPRRALTAVASAHAPLYLNGKETGLFIIEALHPFKVFCAAGFEVDLISETETETYQPDWLSQTKGWLPEDDRKIWEDHSSEFRSKLDHLLKPSDIKPEDYGLFFASAGHASLIDYPDAKGLQSIASDIYAAGGIISTVTGFTTKGEEEEGVLDTIKSWHRPTIEASASSAGATYVTPPGPWDAFAFADGRIVTGANTASAHVTTEEAVKAFDKL